MISVVGRRTGEEHTFPVGYTRNGDLVEIEVGWPERKRWWRNLLTPAPARIRLEGRDYTGTASATAQNGGVRVRIELDG